MRKIIFISLIALILFITPLSNSITGSIDLRGNDINVVSNGFQDWFKVKQDGIQKDNWRIEYIRTDSNKIKVCAYPKQDTRISDPIAQANRILLKRISGGQEIIEPSDTEVETAKGKIVKMCFDVDKRTYNSFQIGSSTAVYELQEDKSIVLNLGNGNNATINVYTDFDGDGSYTDKINGEFWAFNVNQDTKKWGLNYSGCGAYCELRIMVELVSSLPIAQDEQGYYIRNGEINERIIDKDICEITYSYDRDYFPTGILNNPNCVKQLDGNAYRVYATGKDIDGDGVVVFDPVYSSEPFGSRIYYSDVKNTTSPYDYLVGYYSFDEDSATKVYDLSSYQNDLSYWGNLPDEQSCVYDNCHDLDGTDDYFYRADDTDFNMGTGAFTLGGWFRIEGAMTTTVYMLFNKQNYYSNGLQFYYHGQQDPKFQFYAPGFVRVASSNVGETFNQNQWYHIMVSKMANGTTMMYINGVAKTGGTGTGNYNVAGTELKIGTRYDGIWDFDGKMDEIMIFKGYALNQSEIQAIYNNQSQRFVQETIKPYQNFSIASDNYLNNTANLTITSYENNFGSNVTATLQYYTDTWHYSSSGYKPLVSNGTAWEVNGLLYDETATSLRPVFNFTSGTNDFYTAYLQGNVTINTYLTEVNSAPVVTLISPANNSIIYGSPNISFYANHTDVNGNLNFTLLEIFDFEFDTVHFSQHYITGFYNTTNISVDLTAYGNGVYYWNYRTCDDETSCSPIFYEDGNYFKFTLDTIIPVFSLIGKLYPFDPTIPLIYFGAEDLEIYDQYSGGVPYIDLNMSRDFT